MTNTYITDAHRSSVEEVLSKALNGEMTDNFIFPLFTKVKGGVTQRPKLTQALTLSPSAMFPRCAQDERGVDGVRV
tara:strand:- start:602 stop:829 length:228 start_codon:yes stop_codon:yes gene_type:complete